ncbi:transposase [Desulfovibrio sp. DV]|uniref:transposase n=1 Tax=Desulfovibrio sp. DV TaxID=1844708 RepID=UPI0034C6DEB7
MPLRRMVNGHIESFNGRLRDECLNAQTFRSLAEAKRIIEDWRKDYNTVRPHSALAGMSPEEYRRAVKGENPETKSPNLSLVYSMG